MDIRILSHRQLAELDDGRIQLELEMRVEHNQTKVELIRRKFDTLPDASDFVALSGHIEEDPDVTDEIMNSARVYIVKLLPTLKKSKKEDELVKEFQRFVQDPVHSKSEFHTSTDQVNVPLDEVQYDTSVFQIVDPRKVGFFDRNKLKDDIAKNPSLFFEHISKGEDEMVVECLEADPEIVNKINEKDGLSPLLTAVKMNQREIALTLLRKGADPNITDSNGNSVMEWPICTQDEELGIAVLEKTDISDFSITVEKNIYDRVMLSKNTKLFDKLFLKMIDLQSGHEKIYGTAPIIIAAEYGLIESLKDLIENKNIPVDDPEMITNKTALLVAVAETKDYNRDEHYECVKYLLAQGANPYKKGNDFKTVLHFAADNGLISITQLLVEKINASKIINSFDKEGLAPLHLAARNGNNKIIEILVDSGADPYLRDKRDGKIPYDWAKLLGKTETRELLARIKPKKK